jgi:hypothetical protein
LGPNPASGGNLFIQKLVLFFLKIMKKFLILFRHGFGFLKAQLIFWPQTQPVVTTLFQNPNQPYKNLKRVHVVRKKIEGKGCHH